jgi:hypothetical protein
MWENPPATLRSRRASPRRRVWRRRSQPVSRNRLHVELPKPPRSQAPKRLNPAPNSAFRSASRLCRILAVAFPSRRRLHTQRAEQERRARGKSGVRARSGPSKARRSKRAIDYRAVKIFAACSMTNAAGRSKNWESRKPRIAVIASPVTSARTSSTVRSPRIVWSVMNADAGSTTIL